MSLLDVSLTAYSQTGAPYVQPAVGSTVVIFLQSAGWIPVGSTIFIAVGGFYTVTAIGAAQSVVARNLGSAGNASPTTVIATNQRCIAVGVAGTAGASGPTGVSAYVGDGRDGNLTASSGVTTLSKDTFYATITLSGTASIDMNGYKLSCLQFDARNAQVGAIHCNGAAGTNNTTASGSTAAGATGRLSTHSLGGSTAGGTGASTRINGSTGGSAVAGTSVTPSNGGSGGTSGNSGAGVGGGGAGTGAAGGAASAPRALASYVPDLLVFTSNTVAYILGGGGGAGGASGGAGPGGSDHSGTGGGGGAGGGVGYFAAGEIITGVSTPAGVVQCRGGAGGNGGNADGTNAGGSSGACGGGGGFLYCLVGKVTGSAVTGFFDANGGAAGTRGAPSGSGAAGTLGAGGLGGVCSVIYITGPKTYTASYGAASGITGGVSAVDLDPAHT